METMVIKKYRLDVFVAKDQNIDRNWYALEFSDLIEALCGFKLESQDKEKDPWWVRSSFVGKTSDISVVVKKIKLLPIKLTIGSQEL